MENLDYNTQKRLKKNLIEALKIVVNIIGQKKYENIGGGPITIDIFDIPKNCYGRCKTYRSKNYSVISINRHLLNYDDKIIIEVLIHEILHTLKDTRGHNKKWQYYANKINENTEYKVVTRGNIEGVDLGYRYKLMCSHCGLIYGFFRMTKLWENDFKSGLIRCTKCKKRDVSILDTKKNTILYKNSE